MAGSVFSQSWHRVAHLRPRLRSHVHLHRQHFRGHPWYVLQDELTGQYHRFGGEAYQVIGLLNGERTLQSVWDTACARLGDDMPSQDEVIGLVSRLHRVNLLQSSLPPDVDEQVERGRDVSRKRWLQQIRTPLGIRIPLVDPEAFLNWSMPVARWLFSTPAAVLWLVAVCSAAIQVPVHWEALTGNLSDRVFATENLMWLWITYPLVKVIHELGHAYAVKRWGGQVHDMGVMLLVFVPVPYVDASAASAFAGKWQRAVVGAAGILVEMFIAAIALHVWLQVEPGAVRAVAFNAMLITGVSTLLFNGNPLLRFDAYYVLADLIEIPNLAQRGNQYVGYLIKRYLFGVDEAVSPVTGPREQPWLLGYAVASFVYRMVIMVSIVLFVAGRFYNLGVALAAWSILGVLVLPMAETIKRTLNDSQIRPHRTRALLVSGALVAALVAGIALVPAPLATRAEGVVQSSDESQVRAAAAGVVESILVPPGARVAAGQALVALGDAELNTKVRILEARIREAEARAQAARDNRSESRVIEEEIAYLRQELARAEERRRDLVVRAPEEGRLLMPEGSDLIGRYVRKGQEIGHVVQPNGMVVHAVIPNDSIDLIRAATTRVEARFASEPGRSYDAKLLTQVPAASRDLPSPVLSVKGGGRVALDPKKTDSPLQAFQAHFLLELSVPDAPFHYVDERVYLLFEHPPEPLVYRWYRTARRVLLRRFEL